jgi:hypothetical protein
VLTIPEKRGPKSIAHLLLLVSIGRHVFVTKEPSGSG